MTEPQRDAFASPLAALVARARRVALAGLAAALDEGPVALEVYDEPVGDPGLFGPGSVAWRVHGDLGSMLIGGFAALMLQSLHPLPMAGVADHSRYREDPIGRLRRTARFVAGTTFGGTPLVEELLDEVRAVHARVRGIAPDGRAYAADDPALLTYVHVSEVSSFLASYQRFGPRALDHADKDRYLAEVAVVAERLGATGVPRSLAEVRAYLDSIRGELVLTPAAREAISFLREPIGRRPAEVLAHRVVTDAAIELLPGFARRLVPRSLRPVVPGTGTVAGRAFAASLRAAIGPSIVRRRALARVAAGSASTVAPPGSRYN